jgi:hypothetical protein
VKPRPLTFTGKLEKVVRGIVQHVVTVPRSVSAAFGKRGPVPVVATLWPASVGMAAAKSKGVDDHLTLVPSGGGRHKLILNARLRKRVGLAEGARVRIRVVLDEAPPEDPIPEDLVDALREADAHAAFEGIVRSKRNAILRWLDQAVADATRAKRIARLVEIGLEEREKKADPG